MVLQIKVTLDTVQNVHKALEELFVLARVEGLSELLQVGDVTDDGKDVRAVDDFLLDRGAVLGQQTHQHGVENEVSVLEQLDCGESGDTAQQKLTGTLEITDQHAVDTLENLELVLLVPVSAIFNKLFARGNVFLEGIEVILLQVHEDDLKENLHFARSTTRHVVCLSEDAFGMGEVTSLVLQPFCFVKDVISDFDITFTLLTVFDLLVELFDFLFNLFVSPLLRGASLLGLATGEA